MTNISLTPDQLLQASRDLALQCFVLGQQVGMLEAENSRLRARTAQQQDWIRKGVQNITDRLNYALVVTSPEPTAMELGVIEAAGRVKAVMEEVMMEHENGGESPARENGAYRP